MSRQKHLVLDDDVHKILSERKELTGSSIKAIGNSILRTSMQDVLLSDIIGKILVEDGLVSEDDVRKAMERASSQSQEVQKQLTVPIAVTKKGTLISGSLETRQLFRRSDGAFQVLESWTRDSRGLPMEAHRHDADEFFIVLQGRILVTMAGVSHTIRPLNILQVPSSIVHSVKPIGADCHLLVVLVPAVPEYFGS